MKAKYIVTSMDNTYNIDSILLRRTIMQKYTKHPRQPAVTSTSLINLLTIDLTFFSIKF